MPLEIRELIIKARIDTDPQPAPSLPAETWHELKEQVVREAIDKLEELLAERSQR